MYLDDLSRYFFDAAGQLRATDRRKCILRKFGAEFACSGWEGQLGGEPGVLEEYRYDALGRRLMVRARPMEYQCASGGANCMDNTVLTVWDGDQLLVEAQMSSTYGLRVVAYTHGPGIDAPLAVRMAGGYAPKDIVPLANWRGLYDSGVFTDGRTVQDDLDLKAIEWPAENYRASFDYVPDAEEAARPRMWLGSLMSHKRDASGRSTCATATSTR